MSEPNEPTEAMLDAARPLLMAMELGVTDFSVMRGHLREMGVDISYWPAWATEAKGHIPKSAQAHLLYLLMENERVTRSFGRVVYGNNDQAGTK